MSGTVVRGPMPTAPSPATGGAPGAGAGARVLDFRRRGAPPRRRRRHPLLVLLRPLATALLLVALPAGLAAWVLTARRFQLQDLVVDGGSRRVPAGWVRETLAPLRGRNLVRLPLAEVAARLRRNPWVDTVEVRKELPDRLFVSLTERQPVALLRHGGRLVYADAAGRPIVPVDSLAEARKARLLEINFSHPSHPAPDGVAGALEVAGELGRVQPDWAAHLTRIEVLGEDDFRLHTEALRFPLLVTRGQAGPKVRRLVDLLPELERRYPAIERVDLRFSRRIVVQPGAPPPVAAGAGGQV